MTAKTAKAAKIPTLTYDKPPRSAFHKRLLDALEHLTGIKWGYVKIKHIVKYISCAEIPIKIGSDTKQKLDILITNSTQKSFETDEEWNEALRAELQVKLLDKLRDDMEYRQICGKIISYVPQGEYAIMLNESTVQWQKHSNLDQITDYDEWMIGCLKYDF
jgi:hypothetical protein